MTSTRDRLVRVAAKSWAATAYSSSVEEKAEAVVDAILGELSRSLPDYRAILTAIREGK